jgi:hypothetical protein
MDIEIRLRNLEERLSKLEGNKTVTPMMNDDDRLRREQQEILRREQEKFMSPMQIRMKRMKDDEYDDFKGGRRTRRNKKRNRFLKTNKK